MNQKSNSASRNHLTYSVLFLGILMTETRQLTLPITGMTCANCVATVERT